MIADQTALEDLRAEWGGVVAMKGRCQLLVTATFAQGAVTAPALANVVYNLPLLHAFGVLNQALVALRDEGYFRCPNTSLGRLMDGAKTALPWVDWTNLREGVRQRNKVAHDGELLGVSACIGYIDSVAAQLKVWKIIDNAA